MERFISGSEEPYAETPGFLWTVDLKILTLCLVQFPGQVNHSGSNLEGGTTRGDRLVDQR